VQTQTNLVQRGSAYYFRKKVPVDLRRHYGKESIRTSLGTGLTATQAKLAVTKLAHHYESEFEVLRANLRPSKAIPLTAAMVPTIVKALEGHILRADEEIRMQGLSDDEFDSWAAQTHEDLQAIKVAYARGSISPIAAPLEDWLNGLAIDAQPDSPEFKALGWEFLKARLKALESKLARDRGKLIDTPEAPTVEDLKKALDGQEVPEPATRKNKKGLPRLQEVIDYWKQTGEKSHRTIGTADAMVQEFIAINGDLRSGSWPCQRWRLSCRGDQRPFSDPLGHRH